MYSLHDRIKGSLYAAGMGDAIGVPSEGLSRDEIIDLFGGPISDFLDGSENFYGLGNNIAEVTDDASQMYEMAKAVIATGGELTTKAAADALVSWSKGYPKYYPRNCGPTMMHWFEEYAKGTDPVEIGKLGKLYGRGVSNGAAMRVAASGLCNPGDWDGAVKTAVTMTKVSHGTQHAYAGACAISCAIAEAISEHASIDTIIKATIYGCKKGEEIGLKEARVACGERMLPKFLKAIECAYEADNADDASIRIEHFVGNAGDIRQSVPAALGLFIANESDPFKTILAAANIGNDTDTIACIAGMVAGAFKGYSAIPQDKAVQFKDANPLLDFDWAADELLKIAENRLKK